MAAGFPEFLVAFVATLADLFALVGNRVSPWQAPRKAGPPRVTYFLVSGDRVGSFGGPSGLARQRWQVDCWGGTAAEARQVARLLVGTKDDRRLDGYRGTLAGVTVQLARLLDERDNSEPLPPASDDFSACVSLDIEAWTIPN